MSALLLGLLLSLTFAHEGHDEPAPVTSAVVPSATHDHSDHSGHDHSTTTKASTKVSSATATGTGKPLISGALTLGAGVGFLAVFAL